MIKTNFTLFLPLLVFLFSCSSDDKFTGESDIPKTRNTDTDWNTTTKVIVYDEDETTVLRTTETFFDQYGRKTGEKSFYGADNLSSQEKDYIYKANQVQFYDVFYGKYDIETNGTDRFRCLVTYRDNWRDKESETVYKKKSEFSRREWDYDAQGRVSGFRFYADKKLYSGEIDYRYDGDNYTYYQVFYKESGAIDTRIKVDVVIEPNDDGYTKRDIYYMTDGTTVSYYNEFNYDSQGRLQGLRSYDRDVLRAEDKDFEYNGKELVYYSYDYTAADAPSQITPDVPETRTSPESPRYKTKVKKIFY